MYIPVRSAGGGLVYLIVHKGQLFINAIIATNTEATCNLRFVDTVHSHLLHGARQQRRRLFQRAGAV